MPAKSEHTALAPGTHTQPAGDALKMAIATLEQSSIVTLPCHGVLGAQRASGDQPQKPVFGKLKRPGPQLQAKASKQSKAIPSRIKVGAIDAGAYTSLT